MLDTFNLMTNTWALLRFVDGHRAELEAEALQARRREVRPTKLRRRTGTAIVRLGAAVGGIRPVDGTLPIGPLAG